MPANPEDASEIGMPRNQVPTNEKPEPVDTTCWNEFVCEFVKVWRQLDDESKDRVEAELRRLLKEEHGSWEIGRA
jgi:hypothetical protein